MSVCVCVGVCVCVCVCMCVCVCVCVLPGSLERKAAIRAHPKRVKKGPVENPFGIGSRVD